MPGACRMVMRFIPSLRLLAPTGTTLLYVHGGSSGTSNKNSSHLGASARSERFDDDQDDDADQQQRRDFVEHAVPAFRARVAIGGELLQQREAGAVVTDEQQHQQ